MNPAIQKTAPEDVRTGVSVPVLRKAIVDHLFFLQGRLPENATMHDWYMALAYTIRDRMLNRWIDTARSYYRQQQFKLVAYLSAEFLVGPHLGNNILNLGIEPQVRAAVTDLGLDLDMLTAQEEEPGLGNGGLGRLAACFLDSLATLEIPAIGYGIRYEFGIFDQQIRDGWQQETTDHWLRPGNPWEICRSETSYEVKFGGRTEAYADKDGRYRVRWVPDRVVKGIAYDTPILGYGVNAVNILRLWKAEAPESFDFQAFNVGDYWGAVEHKVDSENLTKVLYPNDERIRGKQLRLEQQHFFVSCSLQDMLRILDERGETPANLPEVWAAQMNDTHPSIAVAELMRLLVDEHGMDWESAWDITRRTLSYTNHTLLPEALERWSLPMFAALLPRHLEIIYEINRRFLLEVAQRYPSDGARAERLSLIDERGEKSVRMAHLASVGSHAINGVAALHSELLKSDVLRDFAEYAPEKFLNVTNGVTPRRFLALSNPELAELITTRLGAGWIRDFEGQIKHLEAFVDDSDFQVEWRAVKRKRKEILARIAKERTGIAVDPDSMFDIQVKRLHEYKRQHLNALHIITLYNRFKRNPTLEITPRTFFFAGKAAPGYRIAKLIIKLITSIGDVVNNDPEIDGRIKVVFLPDLNVTNAQPIYPAGDLSEQISTAGKEASGTGNMKFAMNGAITMGTLDGANVEIREEVGAENFFLFGLNTEQVYATKAAGYKPWEYYSNDDELRQVIDLISSGYFSAGDVGLFRPLVDSLLSYDDYLLLADYRSYIDAQQQAGLAYRDVERWTRMSILNTARVGKFSSDRSIRDYASAIWHARPVN